MQTKMPTKNKKPNQRLKSEAIVSCTARVAKPITGTTTIFSTTAVTADSQQLNIQVAQVNVGLLDKTADDFLPLPAAVKQVSGNQIEFSIGELNTNGADVVIAANDAFHINVIAYAFPAN